VSQQVDPILLRFLQAADASAAEHLLQQLMTNQAEPIIRETIKAKLRLGWSPPDADSEEAQDIKAGVTLRVIQRLREFENDPAEKAIADFRSYVAVVAFHACDEYLRRKYPQRHRLVNKLRYILSHRPDFALWQGADGEHYCGFKDWQREKPIRRTTAMLALRDNQEARADAGLLSHSIRRMKLPELVAAVFKWVNGPVQLDRLVQTVAELLGIEYHTSQPRSLESDWDLQDRLADPHADVAREVELRIRLQRLWAEICQLPQRQRAALFLNLRDEQNRGVIGLFPLTGICTFRDVAAALAMTAEELAQIWLELPLDDSAIARRLGVTRQQVINLRKSARERLARRMKKVI
jgi:RNA polymerase sigma factor (sigma-70 family)